MVENFNTGVTYHRILTRENVFIAVNYCSIFMTLAPGANVYETFYYSILLQYSTAITWHCCHSVL